jgi:glutamate-ammonia-ligase adenylyltransferase
MRRLVATEKGEADPWDLKLAAGGLLDIEFIAQTLILAHGRAHPGLLVTATPRVLDAAASVGLLVPADADLLRRAYGLMRDLLQWQRLTVAGQFDPKAASPGLKRRMAAAVGLPDFKILERDLAETRAAVRALFLRLLDS